MLKMYKAATVLSVLMKVYTIACCDICHLNVMVVLQSCTDPLYILSGLSSESFPASDGTYHVCDTQVEDDLDVIEESFIAINKEVDIGIKKEEIRGNITVPGIKSEPDEVS
jgi:hypothetical protein